MKHIYLSNTLSMDQFPNNTSGEFTNQLNQPISNKYLVSLGEIYYAPKTWYNIRQ